MSVKFDRTATSIMALAAVLATAACGGTPDESGDTTPTASPTSQSAETSPAATTTAPAGLEPRSELPPLEDGEAAACIPLCAMGRINDRELAAGTYQTRWFFNGAMTLDLDEPWILAEDSTGEFSLGPIGGP